MCFCNLNRLVTQQQQLNKVIPIMWWLITMSVIKVPELHCHVKHHFKEAVPNYTQSLHFGVFLAILAVWLYGWQGVWVVFWFVGWSLTLVLTELICWMCMDYNTVSMCLSTQISNCLGFSKTTKIKGHNLLIYLLLDLINFIDF